MVLIGVEERPFLVDERRVYKSILGFRRNLRMNNVGRPDDSLPGWCHRYLQRYNLLGRPLSRVSSLNYGDGFLIHGSGVNDVWTKK